MIPSTHPFAEQCDDAMNTFSLGLLVRPYLEFGILRRLIGLIDASEAFDLTSASLDHR